jgi:hypothetical protein
VSPVDRLHPVLLHHVVNTLGWPSLRPLQQAAIHPLLDGVDAPLLAPTAGGKTEAAAFHPAVRDGHPGWSGLSVLYVCRSRPAEKPRAAARLVRRPGPAAGPPSGLTSAPPAARLAPRGCDLRVRAGRRVDRVTENSSG